MISFFKSKRFRTIASGLLLGLFALLASANVAHAGWFTDSVTGGLGNMFWWILYVIAEIFGILIGVIMWAIEIVLAANAGVANTTLVQTGYSISLSIANLGFVFGIILVALATIVRRETYGIKSILWKLVFMGIMVNLALVIAVPIVAFANSMTLYFANAMSASGSVAASSSSNGLAGLKGYDNLPAGIAGLFQPQRLIAPENGSSTILARGTGAASSILGTFIGGIVGLVMGIIGLGFMVIYLVVLFVLIVIRYVYLTVLFIVAPLAWMLWIFPKTSKYFSDWWHRFIQQAFFPPIAMFFIWLVIKTGQNITAGSTIINVANPNSGVGGFFQALGYGLVAPVLTSLVNSMLVVGLMMGGLSAAMKMSTEGSKLAQKVAEKTRGTVQGYVSKQGLKAGRLTAEKTGINTALKNMRTGEIGSTLKKKELFGVPVGKPFGWAVQQVAKVPGVKRGAGILARGTEKYMGNKDLVEGEKKGVPDDIEKVKENLKGSMNFEAQLAHIAKLVEKGELAKDQKVGTKDAKDFLRENNDAIKRYGQDKMLKDVKKLWLEDQNYRVAEQRNKEDADPVTGKKEVTVVDDVKDEFGKVVYKAGQLVDAQVLMEASLESIAKSLTKEDAKKISVNSEFSAKAYKKDPEAFERKLGMIALYNEEVLPSMISKMNASTLTNFRSVYEGIIDGRVLKEQERITKRLDQISKDTSLKDDEKEIASKQLNYMKDNLSGPRGSKTIGTGNIAKYNIKKAIDRLGVTGAEPAAGGGDAPPAAKAA